MIEAENHAERAFSPSPSLETRSVPRDEYGRQAALGEAIRVSPEARNSVAFVPEGAHHDPARRVLASYIDQDFVRNTDGNHGVDHDPVFFEHACFPLKSLTLEGE